MLIKILFDKTFREHFISSAKSKKQPLNCFLSRIEKNKSLFGMGRQRHGGGVLGSHKYSSSKKCGGKLRKLSVRKQHRQGRNKQKGNHVQHLISTSSC